MRSISFEFRVRKIIYNQLYSILTINEFEKHHHHCHQFEQGQGYVSCKDTKISSFSTFTEVYKYGNISDIS